MIHYSDTYEDSWRCNFLGLNHITPLPDHVGLYVLLNIDVMLEGGNRAEAMPPSDLSDYSFTTYSPVTLTDKCKLLLTQQHGTSTNAGLMLGQRRRRWPNINPALVECTMSAGYGSLHCELSRYFA